MCVHVCACVQLGVRSEIRSSQLWAHVTSLPSPSSARERGRLWEQGNPWGEGGLCSFWKS